MLELSLLTPEALIHELDSTYVIPYYLLDQE